MTNLWQNIGCNVKLVFNGYIVSIWEDEVQRMVISNGQTTL
jgi:hypothetical protein